jgi:hypothetical protein
MSEAVTIVRLERGLALSAYLVVRHGPVAVPIFERLERELATMCQTQDTVERAKRLQESYSGQHGRRPPASGTSPLKVDMPSNKQQPGENGPPRACAEAVAKEMAVNSHVGR